MACPNLCSFAVRWDGQRRWKLPPWIPDSLSELTVQGTPPISPVPRASPSPRIVNLAHRVRGAPQLGTTIRPSVLQIVAVKCDEYLKAFRLIKACVGRLPFPGLVFPQASDYGVLSLCLQQLYAHGTLGRAVLSINVRGMIPNSVPLDEIEAWELAKVNEGFAGLLAANVLDIDFDLSCWTDSGDKASVQFSLK
ncbi:hypothetical protein CCMSSC00406_0004779 [Pleurotus cornucopiae]|uniref:Uncharacterized protein n=1 Tax=Pleurotus cornucopiae TaxID=5321 RepID=A0ACB7J2Q1_PLECO|nr:hypothetical protein CCMSSC00406_0004779 [Pleurotus cornucopiae]